MLLIEKKVFKLIKFEEQVMRYQKRIKQLSAIQYVIFFK